MFALALLLTAAHAQSGLSGLHDALSSLCASLTSLLPIVAMLMVIMGAVIYAAGQMMGAETRARANVWATSMVAGALMAILIVVIAPAVLGAVYGGDVDCSGGGAAGCPEGTVWCPSSNSCLPPGLCDEI